MGSISYLLLKPTNGFEAQSYLCWVHIKITAYQYIHMKQLNNP